MALLRGALLSFGARGQIGKTLVIGAWRGITYGREYVVPANPKSTGQVATRDVFAWLNAVWKVMPADAQAPWEAYSKGQPFVGRNALISKNLPVLRGNADLTGYIMSPGAAGGLAGTMSITPGAGSLVVDGTPPAPLPSGWSVVGLRAACILDQDPASGVDYDTIVGTDDVTPYSIDLAPAAGDWWAAGWFVYQKSAVATDLAYGPATAAKYTVT